MQQGFFNRQSPYNHSLVDGMTNGFDVQGFRTFNYTYPIQKAEVAQIQNKSNDATKELIQNEIESRNIEESYEPKTQVGGKMRAKAKFSFSGNRTKKVVKGRYN